MSSTGWRVLAPLVVAAGLVGCDSAGSYKEVYTDLLETNKDQLAILKEVRDEPSMEKAWPELRKISWRFQKINRKSKALPQLSEAAKEEIERIFQPPIQAVVEQLAEEFRRINGIPGGEEFLKKMKHL